MDWFKNCRRCLWVADELICYRKYYIAIALSYIHDWFNIADFRSQYQSIISRGHDIRRSPFCICKNKGRAETLCDIYLFDVVTLFKLLLFLFLLLLLLLHLLLLLVICTWYWLWKSCCDIVILLLCIWLCIKYLVLNLHR